MDLAELIIGRTFDCTVLITAKMVEDFACATGDRNPIHFDHEAAREAGFPARIAHGDLVIPLVNGLLVGEFPGIILLERSVVFKRPVVVGSRVSIMATLTEHSSSERGDKTHTSLQFEVLYLSETGKACFVSKVKLLRITQRTASGTPDAENA